MSVNMRTLRLLVSGTSIAFGAHLATADAATISVDVPVSVFSSYVYNKVSEIPFDTTLGTLVSESLTFSGQVHDTIDVRIFGPSFGPVPGTYTVVNLVGLPNSTDLLRLPDTTIVTNDFGLSTSSYSPVTFPIYGGPFGSIVFDFEIHLATADNPFVPFGGGIEYLDGVLTETFTYIPAVVAAVPEPSSAGLVLAGFVVAGFSAGSHKRRRHSGPAVTG